LVKKYPSLKSELVDLIQSLKQNPVQGVKVSGNCYKIRLAIRSKSKGKSGGARVVTYFAKSAHSVYLLSIFDKSERESLSDRELRDLSAGLPQ
jgi:hypothetical protein